jgi:MYXO-CTERM domain-containing protein
MRHALLWGALLAAGLLAVPEAEACGGFFCSQVPIDQAGERIVFGVRGNTVEAHIQIQYEGAAEQFAWVVPVQSQKQPLLSIGSPQLFTFLDAATQPRFQLQWDNNCSGFLRDIFPSPEEVSDAGPPGVPTNGGVNVVSREEVGPYDAAILTATDAVALRTWLTDNGYDIPEQTGPALEPYVGNGYYFVALKLQQNKTVGDLKPLVVKFEGNRPCVPIRLTAIAARPDMPILAYVLADHRAVPMNYRHVLINPTRVDWLMGGSNYAQVATAAVDEAGGQAFLTEFADNAGPIAQQFESFSGRNYDTAVLAQQTHPVDFWQRMMEQGGPRDGTVLGLMRKYIPMPASLVQGNVQEVDFYNRLSFYRSAIDSDPNRPPFNAAGFAQDLETQVVKPLKAAVELVKAYPYLTRLYTTMSAQEMTVDPDFVFNAEAPPVGNRYTAKASFTSCEQDWSKRTVRIELPDGRYFFQRFNQGPVNQGPNAERVEQYSEVGTPALIQDNGPLILETLEGLGGGLTGGCGCGATDAGSFALLTLLAGAWSTRRRRR